MEDIQLLNMQPHNVFELSSFTMHSDLYKIRRLVWEVTHFNIKDNYTAMVSLRD